MLTLLIGVLALVLVLWAAKAFSKVDPKIVAAALKGLGGFGALGLAILLGLRGRIDVAIPLGLTGLGLLGWLPWSLPGIGARTQKSPGQQSRVRSPLFEMQLDHDTGAMHGHVLAGRYQGQSLDGLGLPALIDLLASGLDGESRDLLIAYLDRREPGWREHAQGDPAAGRSGPPSSGKMTQQEAYEILGLQPGASDDDIARAHRSLMKKLHPDQGGSTYLAARVNQAKDVLVRRHR